MAMVYILPKAEEDLVDIWLYIAEDSPQNADNFLDKLHERMDRLADFPEIGVSRPELPGEVKSFPVDRYLLFYRPVESGIELVRVLHASKDIYLHFLG